MFSPVIYRLSLIIVFVLTLFACGGGNEGSDINNSITAQPMTDLAGPTDISFNAHNKVLHVSWPRVRGVESYRLYLAQSQIDTNYISAADVEVFDANQDIEFSLDTLELNTIYYVIVSAVDVNGVEGFSAEYQVNFRAQEINETLEAPENFSVKGEPGQVDLSWDSVPDALSYQIYFSHTDPQVDPTTAQKIVEIAHSPFTHKALSSGETYYYRISAVTPQDNTPLSAVKSAIIQPSAQASEPPETPKSFVASAGDGIVALQWEPVENADSYTLLTAQQSDFNEQNIAQVTGGLIFRDLENASSNRIQLENNKTYFFKVVAINQFGASEASVTLAATPKSQQLGIPVNLKASSLNNSVQLSWEAIDDATKYTIYTSDEPEFTLASAERFDDIIDTSFIHKNLNEEVVRYYSVTAHNVNGESEASVVVSAVPFIVPLPPTPPSELNANISPQAINVSWTDIPSAEEYILYIANEPGINKDNYFQKLNGIRLRNIVENSFSLSNLAKDTEYYVAVAAVNAGGEGELSSEVKFETPAVVAQSLKPAITLIGAAEITLTQGQSYVEQSATATDAEDGDLSENVVITPESFNSQVLGEYRIQYNVTDSSGLPADEVIRLVTVIENQKPVITLVGAAEVTVTQGQSYEDAGATANDAEDGNLTEIVITTPESFNSQAPGEYRIQYNVTDSSGLAADEVIRLLTIVENQKPVISLLGAAEVTVVQGQPFEDAGATANDPEDGNISPNIETSGTVDTNNIGVYEITYGVKDSGGVDAIPEVRKVEVIGLELQINGSDFMAVGNSSQFTATAIYSEINSDGRSETITALADWQTSNDNVLLVTSEGNNKGLAEALTEGDVTITVNYLNKQAIFNVRLEDLSPPQDLQATASIEVINLSWTANPNGGEYEVVRSENLPITAEQPVSTLSSTTFTDSEVVPGKAYFYAVRTITNYKNIIQRGLLSPPVSASVLNTPENVVATPGIGQVSLSWDPVVGATGYLVRWATSPNIALIDGNLIETESESFVHQPLNNGQTIYYVVSARDIDGQESASSVEVAATVGQLVSDITFNDLILESCVINAGKIFTHEIIELICLDTEGSVVDLSDLKHFSSLQTLALPVTTNTVLSPLVDLSSSLVDLILRGGIHADISPIAELENLDSLRISNATLSVAQLESLSFSPSIIRLVLSDNGLTDISPLAASIPFTKRLTELDLANNNITSVGPLYLFSNLSDLRLTNNQITAGLSSLATLKSESLERIDLNLNPTMFCVNVQALSKSIDDNIDGSTGVVRWDECDNNLPISEVLKLIADQNLVECIRPYVGSMAENIQILTCNSPDNQENNMDLTGLELLANISDLSLINYNIINFSELGKLDSLTELDVSTSTSNTPFDFSNLLTLNRLTMRSMNLQSVDFLNDLSNLTYLDVGDNQLNNLAPVGNLIALIDLRADNNLINNITEISELINLTRLDLSHNQLLSDNGFSALQGLQVLDLSHNFIAYEMKELLELSLSRVNLQENVSISCKDTADLDRIIDFVDGNLKGDVIWSNCGLLPDQQSSFDSSVTSECLKFGGERQNISQTFVPSFEGLGRIDLSLRMQKTTLPLNLNHTIIIRDGITGNIVGQASAAIPSGAMGNVILSYNFGLQGIFLQVGKPYIIEFPLFDDADVLVPFDWNLNLTDSYDGGSASHCAENSRSDFVFKTFGSPVMYLNTFTSNADTGSAIYHFNPLGQRLNFLSFINIAFLTDVALLNGELYATTSNALYRINKIDGSSTLIGDGSINFRNMNALASHRGELYGGTVTGELLKINPSTGTAVSIGKGYGTGLSSAGDLVFTHSGELFASVNSEGHTNNQLASINKLTGEATLREDMGQAAIFGLGNFSITIASEINVREISLLLGLSSGGSLLARDEESGQWNPILEYPNPGDGVFWGGMTSLSEPVINFNGSP